VNTGNKLPAVFKNKKVKFNSGTINLDYGCGKYNKVTGECNATTYLRSIGVTNIEYDPFSHPDTSKEIEEKIKTTNISTVTLSNVLNVIKEKEIRIRNFKTYKKCL